MPTQDGAPKAAPKDGIKAARRADAEAALAIFSKRLNRITTALSALENTPEKAEEIGTSAALMNALQHCAQAKEELDVLVQRLSTYLVLERDQPRNQVAANAHVTTMTLSRWTKKTHDTPTLEGLESLNYE